MNRSPIKKVSIVLGIVLVSIVSIFVIYIIQLVKIAETQLGVTPYSLYQLATTPEAMVKSTDGRINILLLGVPGGDHDGPNLTDTIIVASFSITQKNLALISIPRDIWSDFLQDKINSAYHYGEEKQKTGGTSFASIVVESVISMPIHYSMVIDFSQFEKFIDVIGGIDISIPVGFIDIEYPIAGKENDECMGDPYYRCRYQTVEFQQGMQHMDGKVALMYVRSRHAEGLEGSDFSRGRRQQDVIVSIKSKILAMKPWFQPDLLINIFKSFDSAIQTDLTAAQLLALGRVSMDIQPDEIKKISLESYFIEAPFEMYDRYVLVPTESYAEIHTFVKETLQ